MNTVWCAIIEDAEATAQAMELCGVNKSHMFIAKAPKSVSGIIAHTQARCHNNMAAIASVSINVDQQNDESLIAFGERSLFFHCSRGFRLF